MTVPADAPVRQLLDRPLEIRTARPEEEEQARLLQRAAFSWPTAEPPPHPGRRQVTRVVVRDGRVVSCLTLIHAELASWGASIPMGGIRHVATHPEEQNRGYASALMRDTLRSLRQQGVSTSVLFPFSFRYYRKFGYELGGNHCHFWCRPNCLPAFAERHECRTAGPEDLPGLARFYRARLQQMACSLTRDAARWQAVCADPELRVVVSGGLDPEGYALLSETRDSYGGRVLKVLDLAARTPRAWRALQGYLSQSPVESVEWLASTADLAASGLLRSPAPLREGYKPRGIATVRPMFQVRVVDLEAAVRARLWAFPEAPASVALRLTDELLPENQRPLALRSGPRGAEVGPARPEDPSLEMDIRIFSQLFCGYMSASEAVSQGLARCSSPAALDAAEQFFPPGDPFISELDRF